MGVIPDGPQHPALLEFNWSIGTSWVAKALETWSSPVDHSINIDKPTAGADTARMVSLLVHAALGLTVIGWIVASKLGGLHPTVHRAASHAAGMLVLSRPYRLDRIGLVLHIRFVRDYSTGSDNAIWGPGSWSDYILLMFTNPAASSASQDYTIANVVLLPLFTIVDGYRRGLRRPWLYLYPACSPVSPSRSRSTSPQWNGNAGMDNAALIRRDGPRF